MALFKAMDTLGTGIVSNQAHYKSIHLDYHKQQISYLYIYLACVAGKTKGGLIQEASHEPRVHLNKVPQVLYESIWHLRDQFWSFLLIDSLL